MTTIVIRKDQTGAYRGFYCMGHAGYAKGRKPDILCAAISVLTIGTVNSMKDLAGEQLCVAADESTGFLPGESQQRIR